MELITYPFSLAVGAVWVLFFTFPVAAIAYYMCVKWVMWLTDGKFNPLNRKFDRWFDNTGDVWAFIGGLVLIIVLICAGGMTIRGESGTSYLDSLIFVGYTVPVKVAAWATPLLLPVALLTGASFGFRRLFRVGYSIQERLDKVEGK